MSEQKEIIMKQAEEISQLTNMSTYWNEILKNYKNDKYEILSGIPLSQPQPLTIWKAKLRNNGDLRLCGADFCMGFINNDHKQELEIELVEEEFLGKKQNKKFSVKPNEKTKFEKPILISCNPLKKFNAYPSHYNFSVLYAWFPEKIRNLKELPDLTMENLSVEKIIPFIKNGSKEEQEIQMFWKEILNEYKKEQYGILSSLPYKTNPGALKIWKVKSVKYRENLRACDADFCLGFINNDDENLEIDLLEEVSGINVINHYSLKKNERTQWKTPIWLSRNKFTEFKINVNRSHENFYVLYAWLPKKFENIDESFNLKME